MFVVEYPCDQFCRIELEVAGEHGQVTLQQMWAKADEQHQRIHEPEATAEEPAAADEPEALRRPAATVFRSAPGTGTTAPQPSRDRSFRGGSGRGTRR
jgi:hypothetical protein